MSETIKKGQSKAGRKVLLTDGLARKIVKMIEQMPDAEIAVTWENVIKQAHLRFGYEFHRNTLSQKAWDGKKIIADAVSDAKDVQRALTRDHAPKYANNPRSRLRQVISKLQSEKLVLKQQLDAVRAQQYDEIHSLLDLRTPLSQIVQARAAESEADNKQQSTEKHSGNIRQLPSRNRRANVDASSAPEE